MGIQDAAAAVVDIYRNADTLPFASIIGGLNKEAVLGRVVYQLINTERNLGRLRGMPHREFLDLSAVYRVVVEECGRGTASIAMSHELCRVYGISVDELDRAARENTEGEGFCVMSMAEALAGVAGIPGEGLQHGWPPMYIFSNASKSNGAAVMLYEKYFGELAGKLGSDLYVMPSSIHEVIAVPSAGFDPAALRQMVAEVNGNEVAEEEVLGENVYRYRLETGTLEIV